MSSRCEIRIRTSSFIDLPQPGLTQEEISKLTNNRFSQEIFEQLINKYQASKRALRQLKHYKDLYEQQLKPF